MLSIFGTLAARARRRDETGATATEYALLVGFLAFALILGVGLFGTALSDRFGVMSTIVATFDDHF
jgi:pilus assembly protein Flp/PilA